MANYEQFFKDFMDLAKQLVDDRSQGQDWDPGLAAPEQLEVYDEEDDATLDHLLECYYEDFPGRKFFLVDNLNPDDPGFVSGKSIGVPKNGVVRYSRNQNRLIPIEIPGEEY